MNVMRELRISKVTVNMGVGEGGEKLAKAENLLEKLTEQKPVKTLAKSTNPTFGIRKGVPIACKVTLRKEKAEKFLKKAIDAVERKLKSTNFDNRGNVSFGIKEHIDVPGVRYDPAVGIFGMDVCLTVERPGYRIKRRKVSQRKISKSHSITREEAINFMKEKYNVSVEE
ncbi:MAG: 50S ribosomal protein L5 [Candidatus Hydrothermarchaeota archaeon]|nr:50S ribosomal protein L5 [Candidatus Hydrothermarchaeota archaeon]